MTLPGQMGFFAKFTPSTPAVATYIVTGVSSTNLSTYTFTSANIGTAAADRIVLVAITARGNTAGNFTVGSVTIGGNAATVDSTTNAGNGREVSTFAYLLVPSGTTATIVVNFNGGTMDVCATHIYNINGQASNTPVGSAVSYSPAPSAAPGTQTNGCAVCCVMGDTNTNYTWTNATEDYDTALGSLGVSAAHKNTTSSGESFSVGAPRKLSAIAFR